MLRARHSSCCRANTSEASCATVALPVLRDIFEQLSIRLKGDQQPGGDAGARLRPGAASQLAASKLGPARSACSGTLQRHHLAALHQHAALLAVDHPARKQGRQRKCMQRQRRRNEQRTRDGCGWACRPWSPATPGSSATWTPGAPACRPCAAWRRRTGPRSSRRSGRWSGSPARRHVSRRVQTSAAARRPRG